MFFFNNFLISKQTIKNASYYYYFLTAESSISFFRLDRSMPICDLALKFK